jgi:hypothetical protein
MPYRDPDADALTAVAGRTDLPQLPDLGLSTVGYADRPS